MMDDAILEKLREKMRESDTHSDEMCRLAASFAKTHDRESIAAGITIGRLYNAFYYQTRRMFGRNPTPHEFEDFLDVACNMMSGGTSPGCSG